RVREGEHGTVETFAGTGVSGKRDGPGNLAQFNQPQGLAKDGLGFLWIADSGNHTIRRLDLVSGEVTTIAGSAGSRGFADGTGAEARFDSPMGIAVETETPAQALERERQHLPVPPVQVIVADTGNGVLRRVTEGGRVTTINLPTASSSSSVLAGK